MDASYGSLRQLEEQVAQNQLSIDARVHKLSIQLKEAIAANEALAARVQVLVTMLAEAGTVDEKVLGYRVEAVVEEQRELRNRPKCYRCNQFKASEQLIMTQDGWACDPSCAHTR